VSAKRDLIKLLAALNLPHTEDLSSAAQ